MSALNKIREASTSQCEICQGPTPCKGCKANYQPPGTRRTNGNLEVTLDIDQDGIDRVSQMLHDRGYNPNDWTITNLTVNEWEAMRTKDRGIRTLKQTKATLTKAIPQEDTPWGRLVGAVADALGPVPDRPPVKFLKNGAPVAGITVLMGDDQAPHVDKQLHQASCEALQSISPDRFIYMGDGPDFQSLSKFDVKHPEWANTMNEGLRTMREVLGERLEAAGWPAADYLEGNHEIRLQSFLLNKAPALFGLKRADLPEDAPSVLSVESLLGLSSLGMEMAKSEMGAYPHPTVAVAPKFVAAHGWITRAGGGNSARAAIDRLNTSLATGHTHKLANVSVTRWDDLGEPHIYAAVETGTMADGRGLGYAVNPDWQPGFVTVQTWEDGHSQVDLATWRNGSLTWRDQRWTVSPRGIRNH